MLESIGIWLLAGKISPFLKALAIFFKALKDIEEI
jgi:hypothetical protein